MKNFKNYLLITLIGFSFAITACGDDDAPDEENVVEIFTDVTLIFTPDGDDAAITATATDSDGVGSDPLVVQGPINLAANTTYTLTYIISNALDPNDIEDIVAEILEEDNEHQFFYSFSTDAFTSPAGNGNFDTASDAINYLDQDENGCNVGLRTSWTTGGALSGGTFRTKLQHQPDIKNCTTGSDAGDTDFDLTFTLNIQ